MSDEHRQRLMMLIDRYSQVEQSDEWGACRKQLAKAQRLAQQEFPRERLTGGLGL